MSGLCYHLANLWHKHIIAQKQTRVGSKNNSPQIFIDNLYKQVIKDINRSDVRINNKALKPNQNSEEQQTAFVCNTTLKTH